MELTPAVLTPSAHRDTFPRDHLPPPEQWPELVFNPPSLRGPYRLNCAVELLDRTVDRFGAGRPSSISPRATPGRTVNCAPMSTGSPTS